jgi:PilZ domain-containing protein
MSTVRVALWPLHFGGWQRKCTPPQFMPTRSIPTYFPVDAIPGKGAFHPDRRKRARLQVHWPLLIRGANSGLIETATQDLSSDGFYCFAASPLVPGEIRECTLRVPAHDPSDDTRTLPVHCRVRVVRVETVAESGLYGVGCRIEDYHFPDFAAPVAGSLFPAARKTLRREINLNSTGKF